MTERRLCDEIAADAAGLMALPPGAPERVRAEQHAQTCAGCARALEDGRALLALVSASPLPEPSPAALRRAAAPVLADLDSAPRFTLIVVALVLAAWALPLALMRAPMRLGADFALSTTMALLAALSVAFVLRNTGRSGALFVGWSVLVGVVPGQHGTLASALGLHCALTEAGTAAAVGLGAFFVARAFGRSALDKPVLTAALAGGALAGHAALQVGCAASHDVPHALAFHTGPVALAAALAFVLASAAARRAGAPAR